MFEPGFVIDGTYCVERLLAEGGMARLFLVSHTRLPEKHFALKVIAPHGSASSLFALRFRREAEVMSRLKHPHIVEITDWNKTPEGAPYLVMEYLEGEDLAQHLRRMGPLPREHVLAMVGQIASALAMAHAVGVVHRDLKPGNIFVCNRGPYSSMVKVLDFGIAKLMHEHSSLKTQTQALIGTPSYMSPEQARGLSALITAQSDQFSLGIITYELLTGRRPFGASHDEVWAILGDIITAEMPSLPPELADLEQPLRRALHKQPEGRFPTIEDFAAALGSTSVRATASRLELQPRPSSLLPLLTPPLEKHQVTTLGTQNGEVKRSAVARARLYILGATVALVGSLGAAWSLRKPQPATTPQNSINPSASTASQPQTLTTTAASTTGPHPEAAPEPENQAGQAPTHFGRRAGNVAVLSGGVPRTQSIDPAPTLSPPLSQTTSGDLLPMHQGAAQSSDSSKRTHPSEPHPTPKSKGARGGGPSSPIHITIVGADQAQAAMVQQCLKSIYTLLPVGRTCEIKLARAGSLHLVQAPPQIMHSELRFCLRDMFMKNNIQIPSEVIITAKRIK